MRVVQNPASSAHTGNLRVTQADLIRDLQELIAALDRRVPRVERKGEISIARDAALLREKALRRIEELAGERKT
jgi:hypothetical protein